MSTLQDPRVLDAMLPYMTNFYGNPHSRTHAYGWESEAGVEHAREVRNNYMKILK
jgi:cysteine desulfurase